MGVASATLLLRRVRDLHGVGQRTRHQRPAVEERLAAEVTKHTPKTVGVPQPGVGGDVDVHLGGGEEVEVRRPGGVAGGGETWLHGCVSHLYEDPPPGGAPGVRPLPSSSYSAQFWFNLAAEFRATPPDGPAETLVSLDPKAV